MAAANVSDAAVLFKQMLSEPSLSVVLDPLVRTTSPKNVSCDTGSSGYREYKEEERLPTGQG